MNITIALIIASSFWTTHGVPNRCENPTIVKYADSFIGEQDALEANGISTVARASMDGTCTIWLSTEALGYLHHHKGTPSDFCQLVTHEMGHLNGLEHNHGDGPAIMDYDRMWRWENFSWGCRHPQKFMSKWLKANHAFSAPLFGSR